MKKMQENESKGPVEAEDLSMPDEANQTEEINEQENLVPDELHTEIDKLSSELAEQKDKYLRLVAEFDNYRRRTSKESIEQRQTAGKDIITSLLDVLDDMDRAEQQLQDSDVDKSIKDGILLIFNKFKKILQSKGLQAIQTLHTEFDVEKDEAVSEVEVSDKKLKGKVVAELQKGYMLNDKLIRFAKVVVGK